MIRRAPLLVALFLGASCGTRTDEAADPGIEIITGFYTSPDTALFEAHGGTVRLVNGPLRFVAGAIPPENVPALQAEPAVAYVEEDLVAFADGRPAAPAPQDPPQSFPWGVAHIACDWSWTAHNGITGSDGAYGTAHTTTNFELPGVTRIRVAICDTGIMIDHPDLVGQAVWGANYVFPVKDEDKDGHGTHVAGIVAARDNAIGYVGAAPCAQVVAVKVLNDRGTGTYSAIASGIQWAADNNCRVINLSLSGSLDDLTLRNAVEYAWHHPDGNNVDRLDVVLCAAAGNNGTTTPRYPAAYEHCIAVVSTTYSNRQDVRSSFSNYGSSWCDLSAPGSQIPSTTVQTNGDPTYETWDGTSMASPHVAGVAALVWAKAMASATAAKTNEYVRGLLESEAASPTYGDAPNLVDPWACLMAIPP